jgi:hypothetical protein
MHRFVGVYVALASLSKVWKSLIFVDIYCAKKNRVLYGVQATNIYIISCLKYLLTGQKP